MNWFDPLRPRLANGRPLLVDAAGRPICALPPVTIQPGEAHHQLLISVPRRFNEYEYITVRTTSAQIPDLLGRLLSDPEDTLRMWGWHYRDEAPQRETVSLEDLGL